ncbi:unnamed protein product [Brachionus calyciflorus]|uniref:Uncharacterized protein n=1 Tax=Brachionus calyciflorus TaxID=104777 RepID=A0A813WLE5_9BILA|nr:unnamed protein product [Brachionus calyciflorus]
MLNHFKKKVFFILLSVILFLVLSYKLTKLNTYKYKNVKVLEHECACFKDEKIHLIDRNNGKFLVKINEKSYPINMQQNPILTCNLYKSLKRGPNQKVIAYSLYGKNIRYYRLIANLTQKVKEFFPDHVMRIYHDNSIDESIKCDLECENSHVEFCNIHKLPFDNFEKEFNLNYIHSMKWRFLPIGDSFVDLFMSRDSDSMLIRRELDSVNEWIDSDNIGHIMRDHYQHDVPILGGMWSFKNIKNRTLGKEIFKLIIDENIARKYNGNGKSPKGSDQYFLKDHVYKLINNFSTIHDSFLCKTFSDSKPFPSQRIGDCFIGKVGACNETNSFRTCPIDCRPKNHPEWETC